MGLRSRAFLTGGLGFAAAFVVACGTSTTGSSGLLSSAEGTQITSQLSAITASVNAGHCGKAKTQFNTLNRTIAALPAGINSTVVSNLGQGISAVQTLADAQCGENASTTSSSSSSSTTASTTASTPTTPTTSTTVTTSTTPTSTSSTDTNPGVTTLSTPTPTTPGTATTPAAPTGTNGGAGLGGAGQ